MSSSNPIISSTNLFRRLTWGSHISLSIALAPDTPMTSGAGIDRYYMQVPRYTYLPLLIPEIRENLVELVLSDESVDEIDTTQWWFEEAVDDGDTPAFASQGPCKWHWPLDLIELHSTISRLNRPGPSAPTAPRMLNLILHLSNPPSDKLLLPNSLEVCRDRYINCLKEAEFVRWRNTNKVTSLRKADLDSGWEGIVQDNYDTFMRMASRLLPLPTPPAAPTSSSAPSRPASTDPSNPGPSRPDSSYSARALPVKIYLPDGAVVLQEVIAPISSSGQPVKLLDVLREYLPLLFPAPSSSSHNSDGPYPLAVPLAQGVELPPDADMAWLTACLCGVDGWLRIGIQLRAE